MHSCSTQFDFKLSILNQFGASSAVNESNRFEIYNLELNCVLQICIPYSGYL